ncbi:MAG TPA: histidine phosphatase family protein [Gemmataceae bacterium]|jgi:probable phosphoglycerate mutase|nr:histidine phosphatase family protein [Gemmataceae bacterium]
MVVYVKPLGWNPRAWIADVIIESWQRDALSFYCFFETKAMPISFLDANPLPRRRRLYLVRHGDVSYFDDKGRPFRPNTVPLNDEGKQQAQAAGRELMNVPLDRIVSSDLVRCIETASIISAGRNLPVDLREALREIQPGRLADIPPDRAAQIFLGAFTNPVDSEARFLEGETFGSLAARVLPCLRSLLEDSTWRHLLIVAHGGVNRLILTHALGTGMGGFGALEQDPACINILDVADSGQFLVRLVNYTPYNPLKIELEMTTMERLFFQYRSGVLKDRETE